MDTVQVRKIYKTEEILLYNKKIINDIQKSSMWTYYMADSNCQKIAITYWYCNY